MTYDNVSVFLLLGPTTLVGLLNDGVVVGAGAGILILFAVGVDLLRPGATEGVNLLRVGAGVGVGGAFAGTEKTPDFI